MLVMAMRLAITAPMVPPIPRPPITSAHVIGSLTPEIHRVVRTAMVMPIMPLRLPARLEAGDDRPFSARIKSEPATR